MNEEKLKEQLENIISKNNKKNGKKFNEKSMKANYMLAKIYLNENNTEKAKEKICESQKQFNYMNPMKTNREKNKLITYLNSALELMNNIQNTIKVTEYLNEIGMMTYFKPHEIQQINYEDLLDITNNTPKRTYQNIGIKFEETFGKKLEDITGKKYKK